MKDIVLYAIPVFVLTLILEVLYYRKVGKHSEHYQAKDTAASLSMGIGNVIVGFVAKIIVFASLWWMYQVRIFTLERAVWWYWILIFLSDDFSYYWFHRSSHKIRYFWASHVVHHSSVFYNLGTALRQTWTGSISGGFGFWLWMPLVGFHPVDVMLMQAISLLYQYWIHTELIRKLPFGLEWILNTPSHHRVHHGSDIKYLDKNHGGILIIWDRLFGTFQAEEERPNYGLTKNLETYNPVLIAFHEWRDIIRDVGQAPDLRSGVRYLFGPPGWSHDGSRKTARELQEELKEPR